MKPFFSILLFVVVGMLKGNTQLSLPKIFTDNMVIQQEMPVHFWGKGIPGEKLRVTFLPEIKETIVASDSTWNITMKPRKANGKPERIVFLTGEATVTLQNVVVGDVWLCLGQSNMEWPMKKEQHFEEEVKNANLPLLCFYNPKYAGKNVYGVKYGDSLLQRLKAADFYQEVQWESSNSSTVNGMSAVGYYFGKSILKREGLPVGLINLAIGGCPIETFISKGALKKSKRFSAKVNGNWLINEALPVWVRERGNQNVGAAPVLYGDEHGPNHAYKPGFAYKSGIEPIVKMPVRGVLWYQGESNAQEHQRVQEYTALQKLMIEDYRKKWKQPKMPFYWVQLSSIDTIHYKGQLWPEFRNGQRKLLDQLKYVGMAVSSDIGAKNDVHPQNKKDVGYRLARWALKDVYNNTILPSRPLPLKARYKNDKVFVYFKYSGKFLKTSNARQLKGFSIDGKSEAHAFIEKNRVIIPVKKKPLYIYYGWKPFSDGNLINSENLPASSFKIEVKIKQEQVNNKLRCA